MRTLNPPPIEVDLEELAATRERYPFDRLGWEFIARAGYLSRECVEATGVQADGTRRALRIDEAVNGGLLVRLSKLLRTLFDATQLEESEAPHILVRCALETAINLRWLLLKDDPEEYRKFRADSFVTLTKWLRATGGEGDTTQRGLAEHVARERDRGLVVAELRLEDVPAGMNAWGAGGVRQRLRDLELEDLYLSFFGTHSSYVHGSWREMTVFHLESDVEGFYLTHEYGELAPTSSCQTAAVALGALRDYANAMPVDTLDEVSFHRIVDRTLDAIREVQLSFGDFIDRGGIDDTFTSRWHQRPEE